IVRLEPTSLLFTPSTRKRLPVVLFPFTEKSTPASRPLCLESKFEAGETPGINCVSWAKLRPLSGSSRTSLPSITLPTAPVEVSTCTADDSTTICSVAPPSAISTFLVVVLETNNSTPWLTYSLKPEPFTDRSYVLAGRSAKTYSPCEDVFTVRVSPLAGLLTVTSAPATTAPEGSVTVPRIVPVTFCAADGSDTYRQIASTHHKDLRILEPPT